MSRGIYWSWVIGLIVAGGLLSTFVKLTYGEGAELMVGRWLVLAIVAICLALAALRLRDSGYNEKWAYLVLIPVLNLFTIIAIGIPRTAELEAETNTFDSTI